MSDTSPQHSFGDEFPEGTVVFRENEPGEEMYVILEGRVEVSATVEGKKTVLGILEKGAFFGEMALFDGMPRSATATVLSRARMMVLKRETLNDRLRSDPNTAMRLLKSMCLRLRSLRSALEGLVDAGRVDVRSVQEALRAHLSS